MSRYLKPRDHGYLMEAAACTKVLEDLRRIEAKYARTVEKEGAVRAYFASMRHSSPSTFVQAAAFIK